jgi:hypothetical protein
MSESLDSHLGTPDVYNRVLLYFRALSAGFRKAPSSPKHRDALRERAHVSSTTWQAADRRRGLANRNVLAYGGDECLGFKQTVTSLFDLLR